MTYKEITNIFNEVTVARFNENGSTTFFPKDPANTDYQAYLKWLEEGNTPEPADEPTQGAA